MSKIEEVSLVLKKETKFDKIRKSLFMLIFGKEYQMIEEIERLLTKKGQPKKNIIIPSEIGKKIKKL